MERNLEKATLAGGCFWCIEEVFKELRGVESVVSGYSGGTKENPTYEEVSNGYTGHAEAIEVTFDPTVISFEEILGVFFRVHDPTTLNRQGADIGTQYRSAIFYHDEKQRDTAEKVKAQIESEGLYQDKVVTEITQFTNFYPAEDYHQNFYENNPNQPYCRVVIDPKIAKFRKEFIDKLKA